MHVLFVLFVVNDLGGAATGGGGSSRPADNVVEEIIRQGGRAVGNYGEACERAQSYGDSACAHTGYWELLWVCMELVLCVHQCSAWTRWWRIKT